MQRSVSIPKTALRLGLGLGVVLAIFGADLYAALQTLERLAAVDAEVGALEEAKHIGHHAAASLREQYIQQAHAIIHWQNGPSYLAQYRSASAEARRTIEHLGSVTRTQEQASRAAEIGRLTREIDAAFWTKVEPAIRRADPVAGKLLHGEIEQLVIRAVALIDTFNMELDRRTDAARERAAALRLRERQIEIGAFMLAVVLALLVGALLIRAILKPISRLRAGAGELAKGHLDTRIAVEGRDEFAELAVSFNHMAEEIARHQRDLVRTQRLATIGQMSAGIAHEINNPLGAILGYAKLLQRDARNEQQEGLHIIEAETRQCQSIVRGMLDLARPIRIEPAPVNLAELAHEAVDLLKEAKKLDGFEISVASDSKPVLAWGDEIRLRQVVLNLLANAAEAMPGPGRINLAAVNGATEVHLTVSDTGVGIPAEVQPRMFEPFFTTKPQGTGLGLAISQAIIDAHGGSLEIVSQQGQGTRVTMTLRCPPSAPGGA